ncbi:MAG TPA: hypothetical protein VHI13_08870 [Candidatus Kapabacteria bacterium]|nr:hypothetical protein [Candidatus Kapabacteria bacterium]
MASDPSVLSQLLVQRKQVALARSQLFGFIGASYTSQSISADGERLVNMYLEPVESGHGKNSVYLTGTPGLRPPFVTLQAPTRGGILAGDFVYAVGGDTVYQIAQDGTTRVIGTVINDGGPVSFAFNGSQVLVASGGQANLIRGDWTYQQNVVAASMVEFMDGYFIALQPDSRRFQLSGLFDGETWSGLQFAQWEQNDNIEAIVVAFQELWLLGQKHIEIWYDAGGQFFPFARVSGGVLDQGIVSGFTAKRLDNTIFWLGRDDRGQGMAWRANGWTPQRISNHAVESAWNTYPRIDDAEAWTYQENGHTYYVLYFPSAKPRDKYTGYNPPTTEYAGATWVYDVATGMWHERAFWNPTVSEYEAHKARWYVAAWGKHYVGDRTTGDVYEMRLDCYTDNGWPIRRLRSAPHISTEMKWMRFKRLQIDAQMGVGIQDTATVTGATQSAPVVLTVDTTDGFAINQGVTVSGSAVPDYNGAFTVTAIGAGTITLDNQNVPSAAFTGTAIVQRPGGAPVMTMRMSDDGGFTWGNQHDVGMGSLGQYRYRAIYNGLGVSRDRCYEITSSEPVQQSWIDAYSDAAPGRGS